jgi:hypothetical protein
MDGLWTVLMSRSSVLGWMVIALILAGILYLGLHTGEKPLQKVEKVVPNAALAH